MSKKRPLFSPNPQKKEPKNNQPILVPYTASSADKVIPNAVTNINRVVKIKDVIKKKNSDQLTLDMDNRLQRFVQWFNSWKALLKHRTVVLGHAPLWNTQAFALWGSSALLNIVLLIFFGIVMFDRLPEKVRLFYVSIENSAQQVDKTYIVIAPFILAILFVVQYRLLNFIFTKDRRLTIALIWINAVLNLLLIVAIIQIYRLIN